MLLQTTDGGHVFEVPLDEVGDVQGTKDDAILEFHIDDTALRSREDALTSVTFVLPEGNEDFPGELRLDPHFKVTKHAVHCAGSRGGRTFSVCNSMHCVCVLIVTRTCC